VQALHEQELQAVLVIQAHLRLLLEQLLVMVAVGQLVFIVQPWYKLQLQAVLEFQVVAVVAQQLVVLL